MVCQFGASTLLCAESRRMSGLVPLTIPAGTALLNVHSQLRRICGISAWSLLLDELVRRL